MDYPHFLCPNCYFYTNLRTKKIQKSTQHKWVISNKNRTKSTKDNRIKIAFEGVDLEKLLYHHLQLIRQLQWANYFCVVIETTNWNQRQSSFDSFLLCTLIKNEIIVVYTFEMDLWNIFPNFPWAKSIRTLFCLVINPAVKRTRDLWDLKIDCNGEIRERREKERGCVF